MPTKEQVDRLVALQELERRGELPEEFQAPLQELRNRGIVPPVDPGPAAVPGLEQFAAGAGKAVTDVGRGIGQLAGMAQEAISPTPGLELFPELGKPLQAEIEETKQLDVPLMQTGAGVGGNIAGLVGAGLPASFIPGAGTYAGAAGIGGALGALQPVAEEESRLANIGVGAAGGMLGRAITGGLASVLSPQTAAGAQTLLEEGVPMTPGQILGGVARTTEEKLTSMPLLGDAIIAAQRRSIEGFNRAALNRVLKPLGKKITSIGREGLEEAQTAISAAYDDAVRGTTAVADRVFADELKGLSQMAKALPPERAQQVGSIIKSQIIDKLTGAGRMSGEVFKQADSELGRLAREYTASAVADERQVGNAIRAAQQSLREMLARSNPTKASAIRSADEAYANLLRVESAGAATGAREGIFTPAQLKAAARRFDPSRRKRQFAQGKALMQDLAETGQDLLPSTIPTSGTAERLLLNAATLGGGAAVSPGALAGLLGTGALYTQPMLALARTALTARPEAARAAGGLLRQAAPLSGIAGAGALTGLSGRQ